MMACTLQPIRHSRISSQIPIRIGKGRVRMGRLAIRRFDGVSCKLSGGTNTLSFNVQPLHGLVMQKYEKDELNSQFNIVSSGIGRSVQAIMQALLTCCCFVISKTYQILHCGFVVYNNHVTSDKTTFGLIESLFGWCYNLSALYRVAIYPHFIHTIIIYMQLEKRKKTI